MNRNKFSKEAQPLPPPPHLLYHKSSSTWFEGSMIVEENGRRIKVYLYVPKEDSDTLQATVGGLL